MVLDPAPAPRRRRRLLEAVLLAFSLLSLLIGLAALAAYLLLARGTTPSAADAHSGGVPAGKILAPLALLELAGDPALPLAYQALNADELATAHTTALYAADAEGAARIGLWLQLGRAYAAAEPNRGAGAYGLAESLAVLDNSLKPLERSQALVQVAEGLLAVDAPDAALDAARQAVLMGERLPDLLPAQRSQLFDSLLPVTRALGDETLLGRVEDLARNPYLTAQGFVVVPYWPTLAEPLTADPAVEAATLERRRLARQLSDRLAFTGGADVEPERQALAAALSEEDRLRQAFYAQTLASPSLSLAQQLWLTLDRRSWAVLKNKVAAGAYGFPILPEWEANLPALRQELTAATADIDRVLEGIAAAQPAAYEQALLRVEALDWLALQDQLGLYPDAPTAQIDERLRAAQNELAQLGGPLALPIAFQANAVPPGFRMQ